MYYNKIQIDRSRQITIPDCCPTRCRMNKRKKKHKIRYFRIGMALILLVLIIIGIVFIAIRIPGKGKVSVPAGNTPVTADPAEQTSAGSSQEPTTEALPIIFYPELTANSIQLPEEADTKYAILIDTETNEIVAYKDYNVRMYPASLTKVMTLIVAAENISDLNDTVLITADMIDPMINLHASRAGFCAGETPTLEQVLYGVVLPSGADAALAAAYYVAGSEAAFVEMMNQKAQEMGLKNTHFTNVSGLHDEQHYSTAEDMAMILEYAIQNKLCEKILSTYQYTIPPTEYNPEGLLLTSTLFSRMEGTEMPGVIVKGGKTGYTDEAGQCLESYAEINGKTYIMVLAGGVSKWQAVYMTLSGYSVYCAGGEEYVPPTK